MPHVLDAPERERGAAVAAAAVEQAEPPVGVAEQDVALAAEPRAHRIAVATLDLARQRDRRPVAAEDLPHRRFRPDPAQQLVVLFPHRASSLSRTILEGEVGRFNRRRRVRALGAVAGGFRKAPFSAGVGFQQLEQAVEHRREIAQLADMGSRERAQDLLRRRSERQDDRAPVGRRHGPDEKPARTIRSTSSAALLGCSSS